MPRSITHKARFMFNFFADVTLSAKLRVCRTMMEFDTLLSKELNEYRLKYAPKENKKNIYNKMPIIWTECHARAGLKSQLRPKSQEDMITEVIGLVPNQLSIEVLMSVIKEFGLRLYGSTDKNATS